MTNIQSPLAHLKAQARKIDVDELRTLVAGDGELAVVDVRQREEIAQGQIPGALPVPRGLLELTLQDLVADPAAPLVLYCASGTRSALAARDAHAMGYTDVRSLAGGFNRWKQRGADFVIPTLADLSTDPEALAVTQAQTGPASTFIDASALSEGLDAGTIVAIDVREDEETADGTLPGALTIPRGHLELRVAEATRDDQRASVVLISSQGVRAAYAARNLRDLGYTQVRLLKGGFNLWRAQRWPVEVPRRLSQRDRLRYSRHLLIPEVGERGQLKLLKSKVLLMGAGGLGSPAAYYLAAAGVGTLGIIDSDLVDRSNLQRQILHTDAGVGSPKVDSAAATLRALNPDIEIVPIKARLTSANVDDIFAGYDVVLDGGDNFPTRYLVNDACVKHGVPCVHGSVYRFEGQVTVFVPHQGPCYRCLYPEPPPAEMAPSCAEAGVLGVVPGIIGALQASEVIKLLLGIGTSLKGRLVHFDALQFRFRELKLGRDPACPVCGDDAPDIQYVDYEHFCGVT